jgi:hypothetical protein
VKRINSNQCLATKTGKHSCPSCLMRDSTASLWSRLRRKWYWKIKVPPWTVIFLSWDNLHLSAQNNVTHKQTLESLASWYWNSVEQISSSPAHQVCISLVCPQSLHDACKFLLKGWDYISEPQPQTGWYMSLEPRSNYIGGGKQNNSERNLSQWHYFHHKSHIDWAGANPGLLGERPVIIRLSHGTAKQAIIL